MIEKSLFQKAFWLILAVVLVLACVPLGAHAAITCPAGYQCMAETDANARWPGNYVKYSDGVCGSDIDQTVYYYCFRQKPVTPVCTAPACKPGEVLYCPGQCPGGCGAQCTVPTTTPVTTKIPQVSCPAGSQCMSDAKAKSTWGQGNYEQYSTVICGTGPVSSPYGGIDFCYGPAKRTLIVTTTPIPVITTPVKTMITSSGSVHVCAQIPCEPPKVLYCPDKCPGGCGVRCVLPKEIPTLPPPNANFVFSGIVDEWRFDLGQDMSREAPRYMQRVNNETVMLYGSYYSTGYDVGDYIASGTTNYNGEYSIALGPNMPQRNYTYYFLSPDGAFNGRPWVRFEARTQGGKTVPGRYGTVIYYTAPLTGKTGSGNDFMFFTRNTTGNGTNPAIVNQTHFVPPRITVTPPMLVQQTPDFNIITIVFNPLAEFFRGLFGGASAGPVAPVPGLTPPQCAGSTTACNDQCVNLQTDNTNCGKCGYVCQPGLSCWNGKCGEGGCENGGTICSGTCRDLLDDDNNCGDCGNVCQSGTICINGYCGSPDDLPGMFHCDDPTNPTSMYGDPRTNPYCCGGYGHTCRTDQICVNGQCRFPPAPRPVNPQDINTRINTSVFPSSCNGQLVDLNTDRNNCGACNRTCEERQSCINGRCAIPAVEVSSPAAGLSTLFSHEPRCIPKYVWCLGTDTECYRCQEGMICTNGNCLACNSSGLMICPYRSSGDRFDLSSREGEECVNSLSDPNNCGSCGKTCGSGTFCCNGTCVVCGCEKNCGAGQRCCDGKCICDTCPCSSEPTTVICPSGQTNCNGWCVDKQTNNQNCGSCGHICNHNCPCIDGACCPATFDAELKTWSCDC